MREVSSKCVILHLHIVDSLKREVCLIPVCAKSYKLYYSTLGFANVVFLLRADKKQQMVSFFA